MVKRVQAISGLLLTLCACSVILYNCNSSPTRFEPRRADCWKPLPPPFGGVPVGYADHTPVWSNSGRVLAYTAEFDTCNDFGPSICFTDKLGSYKTSIGLFASAFRWLPGDTMMIINTGLAVGGRLWKVDLVRKTITDLNIDTYFPPFDVSPNGRYIYYLAGVSVGDTSSGTMEHDLLTGNERLIGFGSRPAVSPDGNQVAIVNGLKTKIYDLRDSSLIEIQPRGHLRWHPSGDSLLGTRAPGDIVIMSLDGSERLIYGDTGNYGAFGPIDISNDGRTVYFMKVSEDLYTHIWSIRLDGTRLRQVTW